MLEGSELFGNDHGRVIGEHDAAGAHPDGADVAGDVANDHSRGSTGDTYHVVMLCHPEAIEAERLNVAGEFSRIAKRAAGRHAFRHRYQIKNGERGHSHPDVLMDWKFCRRQPV